MFGDVLARVEARLELPYPERALFLEELAADLDFAYRVRREEGLGDEEAQKVAIQELEPDDDTLLELAKIHQPRVRAVLSRVPINLRGWLEPLTLALPMALAIAGTVAQLRILNFLREGGTASFVILFVGFLGVLLEVRRAVVLLLIRDHSKEVLRRQGQTSLYLAAATLLLGIQGTALGYYVVLDRYAAGLLDQEALRIGLREPLPCLIAGAAFATVIVLGHGILQANLRSLRVPERV